MATQKKTASKSGGKTISAKAKAVLAAEKKAKAAEAKEKKELAEAKAAESKAKTERAEAADAKKASAQAKADVKKAKEEAAKPDFSDIERSALTQDWTKRSLESYVLGQHKGAEVLEMNNKQIAFNIGGTRVPTDGYFSVS